MYSSYWIMIILLCCSAASCAICDFPLIFSIGLVLPIQREQQGKKSLKSFPQGKEYYFCQMVMTLTRDILLQGDFGTGNVVLAVSVCSSYQGTGAP